METVGFDNSYYRRHREEKLAKAKAHYQAHKEEKLIYQSAWTRAHHNTYLIYQRLYAERNVRRGMLNTAKGTAKRRHLPFSITVLDIVIPQICPYLGIPLIRCGKRSDNSPSLDRIIPAIGYVPGNVEVISYRANRLKNDGNAQELRLIADRLEALTCPR